MIMKIEKKEQYVHQVMEKTRVQVSYKLGLCPWNFYLEIIIFLNINRHEAVSAKS